MTKTDEQRSVNESEDRLEVNAAFFSLMCDAVFQQLGKLAGDLSRFLFENRGCDEDYFKRKRK